MAGVVTVPDALPVSGKRGAETLKVLERRAGHLAKRVKAKPYLTYDRSELGAINWVIGRFLRYESLLKADGDGGQA